MIRDFGRILERLVSNSGYSSNNTDQLQNAILFIISAAAMIAGLSANIQNREWLYLSGRLIWELTNQN